VVAQNTYSMTPFSLEVPQGDLFPDMFFSSIVSAMMLLLSHMLTQAYQHHGYLPSVHDDLLVMQRATT